MGESKRQAAWRDQHPDRYGPIYKGDYGPYEVNGQIHFVRFFYRPRIQPDDTTACGLTVDDDWKAHPKDHPIAGVVDCSDCLALYEASVRGDTL